MAVQGVIKGGIDSVETIEVGVTAAQNPRVSHTEYSKNDSVNASSTVPGTDVAYDLVTLDGSGKATIDLTALVGTYDRAVDGTGLKVQGVMLTNKGAGDMVFTPGHATGGADPYLLLGAAFKITLKAGQWNCSSLQNLAEDIASGVKNIAVNGTIGDTFELSLLLG